MKLARIFSLGLVACLYPLSADTIPVTATGGFTIINNTWQFTYVSGAPEILLQQITIDLSPTNIRFDTAAGGFGSLGFQDVGNFGGTDATTGLTSISATGTGLDGGSILTFTFADFTVGDTFVFSADVDHPNPNLATLANCTGLGPIAKALCVAANGVKTVANGALLLAADTVINPELANADITFQFAGPTVPTTNVSDTLRVTEDVGLTDNVPTPEPASFVLGAAGLALIAGLRRFRKRG